ncbi:MAG: hypothetical protein AB1801_23475 [Chloroflexota bacterium]
MTTHRYSVSKISTVSLAKFGCVLGGLALFLPGLLCALGSVQVVAVLRQLLDRWQTAEIDLAGLGVPVEFDFITLLGLEAVQAILTRLDDHRPVLALLIVLVSVIAGGALAAAVILLVGWGYNVLAALSGGLEVELRE